MFGYIVVLLSLSFAKKKWGGERDLLNLTGFQSQYNLRGKNEGAGLILVKFTDVNFIL